MAKWNTFEELPVWQSARVLAKEIYNVTSIKPFSKDYRFVQQICSAAGSVMDNIAEGFERENNKEFINFLLISKSSCGEVRSQLHRAKDVGFISESDYLKLLRQTSELSRSLANFINYLKQSNLKGTRHSTTEERQVF